MHPRKWLAATLCGLLIGAAGSCHKPLSQETRSYYMTRTAPEDAAALGCANADKSGRLTLFFGAPTMVNGVPGATLWGAPNQHVYQIAHAVKEFVRGYATCRQDPNFRLLIGIGTSNSGIDARTDDWLYAHGRVWGNMVRDMATWAATYYPFHAQIFGAWDFEPSWSQFGKAESWMHGYDLTDGRPGIYINASADGCPTQTAVNQPCNNGWNQWEMWHLAWQHNSGMPFPQIYATSGVNARQWQLVDLYAATHQASFMFFFGTMTQAEACRQNGGCSGTDNTNHQAQSFMLNWLNSDQRTSQGDIEGMTDIRWFT